MSDFDDRKTQTEDDISQNINNAGKNALKTGGKIAYKGAKKIGTTAGKKLFTRGAMKKTGLFIAKSGKAVALGLMNIGKFILIALKIFLGVLLSWGWIIIPVCLIIIIIWWLMPGTRHFTLDGINQDSKSGETTMVLADENLALDNYFKFYANRVLNENKVKISYDDIDDSTSGKELFEELNDEEYIIGPFKPNKIVQPKQSSSSSTGNGGSGSGSSGSGGSASNTGDYSIPKIEDIISYDWTTTGKNVLKMPKLEGEKLTSEQIDNHKFLVYDIKSGKTFYLVRTMGANHNDVEYATEQDVLMMKEALEKEGLDSKNRSPFESWNIREVFVIQGNNAIVATWTTYNHAGVDSAPGLKNVADRTYNYGYGPNYDNIKNGVSGHMDLYFPGGVPHGAGKKNYHKQPLADWEKEALGNKQKYLDLLNSYNDTNTGSPQGNLTSSQFKNAVFMGDSLTVGIGQAVSSATTFATTGHTVKKGMNEHLQDIINKKPSVVIISYGTNDAGYGNTTSFKNDYKTLISKLKEGIPNVKIYVNKIFPGNAIKPELNSTGKTIIKNIPEYNNALSQIASETGVTLIDCTKIDKLQSYYADDGIHFKAEFYKLWYEEMERQLVNKSSNSTNARTIDTNTKITKSSDNSDASTKTSDNSKITIMIDPGHGGLQPGAIGFLDGKMKLEKDIALDVSLMVRDNLKALGYNVIMSRETDKTIGYGTGRTNLSNDYADLCVSIHCNSGGDGSARGIETFYATNGDKTLATHIQTQIIKETNAKDRGVKPSSQTKLKRIGILDNNKKKAALVELGFMNNKEDLVQLVDISYQEKLTKGIVNGIQSYHNNTPIDNIVNSGSGSSGSGNNQSSNDVYNIVDEMEGFISTSVKDITDKEEIKKETIDKMESYWENKAKPTLGWEWTPSDIRKDLNKTINDSYSIKPFEEIDKGNKEYNFKIEEEEAKKLKDKYGREEYFKMTPELIYSLNQSLYKNDFIHSESLIKPVKINEKTLELDYTAFNQNSVLSESEKTKYGLGTVFVYRPVITFKIEKGVEINQTEVSKVTLSGDTKYDSKPTGRVIYNYDAKIDYVLERAITFAGEYIFTYEEEVNLINEQNIEDIKYDSSKGIATGRLVQSKTYEVTEVPKSITFNNKGRSYIYNYLEEFVTVIPKEIIENFNKQRLYDVFKYYENPETEPIQEDDENPETTTPGGGSGLDSVEQWRALCEEIGPKWGIDPTILLVFIHTESTGNPHAANPTYGGLCAMRLDGGGDIKHYFKDDPVYKNYTAKDIRPSCTGGTHNQAEHERVARYNIEYAARRFSATMGYMLHCIYGLDYRTDILSDKHKQDAAFFAYCGHQTGEYGQMTIYDNYKDDPQLYSAPGTYYTSLFLKHFDGKKCDCSPRHPKGITLYSSKKGTASPYGTENCSNRTYLEKGYKHYGYYGQGITFDKSVENHEYAQQKWYKHPSMPDKPGSGGGGSNNEGSNNGSSDENTTENSVKYDYTLALNYAEYEKTGWFKNDDRYSTTLDQNQIELMLANATAMKEELTVNEVEDGDYAFWDKDFLKQNFRDGLPIGRTVKDYRNTLFSDANWKKIIEIVKYLEKYEGALYVPNVTPWNSSNLIGHVYKVYTGISLPRTPKGILNTVKNKVDNKDDIVLGDILILRPINSHDSEFAISYPTETAICVGEDKFMMIGVSKVISYKMEVIESNYEILQIVRPISTEKVKTNSENSNPDLPTSNNPTGEWMWPVDNPTLPTRGFSPTPVKHPDGKQSRPHWGVDLKKTKGAGDPIYATRDGEVTFVLSTVKGFSSQRSYGNYIIIKHDDGYSSLYSHLEYGKVYVKVGDRVKQGQTIGGMGDTGYSFGVHLHFEIRTPEDKKVDPMNYLTKPQQTS